jgi:exodeoxyribonuclease-3
MLLTGAGEKAFAAGTDISQFRAVDKPQDALDYESRIDRVLGALERCRVPTVAALHGQKTDNGVAILSRRPSEDVRRGLPGDDADAPARYIEAPVKGVRVASIYLPNGNPSDSEKFPYKLGWMERLRTHVRRTLLPTEMPLALGGDYNCCPTDKDVYDPKAWADDALCRPETRAQFRALVNLGLTEAWRSLHNEIAYSFWDYQGGAWQRDLGLRIDHFLLSPQAADRLVACEIDRKPRGKEKASDHTPVWVELSE